MLVLQESSQVCLLLRQAHLARLLRPQDTVGPCYRSSSAPHKQEKTTTRWISSPAVFDRYALTAPLPLGPDC